MAHVVFEIEVFHLDPVRVIDAERDIRQALPEGGGQRQASLNEVEYVFVPHKFSGRG